MTTHSNTATPTTPAITRRGLATALVAALALGGAGHAIAADTAHAIVTLPADAATRADVARRIAQWQHDGDIAHVAWIDTATTGNTTDGSALVFLDFPSERAWGRWMRRSAPAFADTVDVRRADVLRASGDGQHTHAASAPAVKVKIDQPTVPRADYEHFVDAYVTPQLQGERHAGGLLDYTLYLERDVAGPARSLLVMEYRDTQALTQAREVNAEVRRELAATDAAFRTESARKAEVRQHVTQTEGSYARLVTK